MRKRSHSSEDTKAADYIGNLCEFLPSVRSNAHDIDGSFRSLYVSLMFLSCCVARCTCRLYAHASLLKLYYVFLQHSAPSEIGVEVTDRFHCCCDIHAEAIAQQQTDEDNITHRGTQRADPIRGTLGAYGMSGGLLWLCRVKPAV